MYPHDRSPSLRSYPPVPPDRCLNAIQSCRADAFEHYLSDHRPLKVLDGYAPFCELHVHANWTSTRCYAMPITEDNRHRLRGSYQAQSSDELPVLVRWFEGGVAGGALHHSHPLQP